MICVHLNQLREGRFQLTGEESGNFLDVGGEGIVPMSPVRYELEVGQSGSGIWAVGKIAVDIELECVHTLSRFLCPIRLDDFATQVEIEGKDVIDLTPVIREDILLALPAYPDCERDGNIPRVDAPDKVTVGSIKGNKADGESSGERGPSPWQALDRLETGSE